MNPSDVELHIEELLLHGFAASDRHRIAEAVEGELARLLAERGVPPALAQEGELARVDGGSFDVAPDSSAEAVGNQATRALYGGLKR